MDRARTISGYWQSVSEPNDLVQPSCLPCRAKDAASCAVPVIPKAASTETVKSVEYISRFSATIALQTQLFRASVRNGNANQAATMHGHEVY